MDKIKLLLLITILTIIPGQLIRIPIVTNGFVTLTDISVILTVTAFLLSSFFLKKKIYLPPQTSFSLTLFTLIALFSLIFALTKLNALQVASSSLFLIRFFLYFFIAIATSNIITKKEVSHWLAALNVIGIAFALSGLLQLIFFPELRFLAIYGWDPHVNRLVSSLLDPNFTGGLLLVFLGVSTSMYLFKRNKFYLLSTAIFMTTIVLTFSRSSYLGLFILMLSVGLIKSPKVFAFSLLAFLLSIVLIPRVQERVIGVITLDETAQARLDSWKEGMSIFRKSPLFGVGFNTYRYTQIENGNFSVENPQGGHSGAGTDSSFLLVAATTGIIGLAIFLLFLLSIFKITISSAKHDYVKLATCSSFLAIMVHTQFVNSFFFPQIMIALYFLLGLNFARK